MDKRCCTNHPDKNALSVCHTCGKPYCKQCLVEGKEFYYCRAKGCMPDGLVTMDVQNVEMAHCSNHPDKEALSVCRICRKPYCKQCLVDDKEFYYCRADGCMPEGLVSTDVLNTIPAEKRIGPGIPTKVFAWFFIAGALKAASTGSLMWSQIFLGVICILAVMVLSGEAWSWCALVALCCAAVYPFNQIGAYSMGDGGRILALAMVVLALFDHPGRWPRPNSITPELSRAWRLLAFAWLATGLYAAVAVWIVSGSPKVGLRLVLGLVVFLLIFFVSPVIGILQRKASAWWTIIVLDLAFVYFATVVYTRNEQTVLMWLLFVAACSTCLLTALRNPPFTLYRKQADELTEAIETRDADLPALSEEVSDTVTPYLMVAAPVTETQVTVAESKKCPYCAETIKAEAIKCKHCGEWLQEKDR